METRELSDEGWRLRMAMKEDEELRGHQNAHKAERALEKQPEQRYDGGGLGLGQPLFIPYYSYPSTLLTPPYYRALGTRMESMIQKPHPRFTPHSVGYSHGALCLQEILNPSLMSLRNMGGDTLTPTNRRNETTTSVGERRNSFALSVFDLPGRHGGAEQVCFPGDNVLKSAHVHVLINYTEVQPYLELFLTSEGITPEQSSAKIHDYFPQWFAQHMYLQVPTPTVQHLMNLSVGPKSNVKQFHTYFVNGYKFHTQSWTEGKETKNSGVCVKSVTENGEGDDFYGVIKNIFEVEYIYLDNKNTVVLFYCSWFDPSTSGTKFNSKTNTVDIKMNRRYQLFDPFAMAHNVRQVYYVPYPSIKVDKRGWCTAITTKPRGRIEKDGIDEDDHPYQIDEMTNVDDVIAVEPFSHLCVGGDETEEVPSDGDIDEDDEIHLEDDQDDDEELSDWDAIIKFNFESHADFTPPPPSLTADLVFTPPSPSRCSSTTGMSLAAAGDPPVPPPGGGGDLGGHGSNSSRQRRAGRGRGKKLAPCQLKHRVVYNRDLTDMPRRVLEDGYEVPLEPDPEEETRVDTEITRADLLAPDENILVDRHGRIVLMPYADDFQPQKHASVAITKTIVANYHEPFISWKEVKKNKKAWESFWNTFCELVLAAAAVFFSGVGRVLYFFASLLQAVLLCPCVLFDAALYLYIKRRLKADNEARLQSRLDEMRSQLREEARQDMELMVQRVMSQRDQGYQPQQPQQYPQHIPPRHSAYASSHPHQQPPRHLPQIPARHSVHETSQFQPIQPPSSSYHESGGSSQHPGPAYRPTFDNSPSTSHLPPFDAATNRANVNLMSNQDMLEEFVGSDNQVGNQGGNRYRTGGRGSGNENSNNAYYPN
ncbi:zinc finger protein [Trifolium repens]|nr:zinc finger protein [Trifolium repens]